MKYIIMCGGNYKDFETPKHLLKVKNERLVDRTIRLLRENNISDIAITSLDPRFDSCGVPRIEHKNEFTLLNGKPIKGFWLDAFLPSDEPITYLYGDVYYSDAAIKKIVETETDDVLFFASRNVHRKDYFKEWEEPFAFKVANQKKFRECIDYAKRMSLEGRCNREPISWELYRVLNGYDINTHIIGSNFIAIDDYTTDIDCIEDIQKLEEII